MKPPPASGYPGPRQLCNGRNFSRQVCLRQPLFPVLFAPPVPPFLLLARMSASPAQPRPASPGRALPISLAPEGTLLGAKPGSRFGAR